jgi:hypothetical protein
MSKSQTMLGLVLAIILIGASFFAGTKYAESRSPAGNRFVAGQQGGAGRGAFGAGGAGGQTGAAGRNLFRGAGGNMTAGEVSKIENGILTLKTPDGGSKLIVMSSSTKVMQMSEINLDALKTSTPVMIMGTANSDGSVTAASIQIRPGMPQAPSREQLKP